MYYRPPWLAWSRRYRSSWYRSEKVFGLEKERIFFCEWLCVGREEELPSPGSHRVLDVLGESVILVRNRQDQLRAFYNVCRHRGARLCRTDGTASRIVCPYHQWTYNLDGHLLAAPYLTAEPGFDKSLFSLYPIGVETWGGFVFLNLTPANAKPFLEQAAGIPERTRRYPLSELRIGHTIEYQVAANWKVLCENYNECYHCAGVHPELCAIVPAFRDRGGSNLDWERGIPHREGAYTFTKSGTTRRRAFLPTLNEDEQVRHKGEPPVPQPLRESRLRSRGDLHSAAPLSGPDRHHLPFPVRALRAPETGLRPLRHRRILGRGEPAGLGHLRDRTARHFLPGT